MATDIPGFPQQWLDYKVDLYSGAALLKPITTPATGLQNGMLWITSAGVFARVAGSTVGPFGASALVGWTASLNTADPNNTINAARFLATGGTTDVDAVIQPKGEGSLIAQLPDNTATGGNKRGINSVDVQTARTAATQVCSGSRSSILGGSANTNDAASNSTIVGGHLNTISSGSQGSVVGGESNTSGSNNSATFGAYNNNSGYGAMCFAHESLSNAAYGFVAGRFTSSKGRIASMAQGVYMGSSIVPGANQRARIVLGYYNQNSADQAMTANTVEAGAGNQVYVPRGTAIGFCGTVVASRTTNGNASFWKIEGLIKNIAGTVSFVGTPTVTLVAQDAGAATWVVALVLDTANQCLGVTFKGIATGYISATADIEIVEAQSS